MMAILKFTQRALTIGLLAAGLSACGTDDVSSSAAMQSYQVTIYNDTAAQALSPVMLAIHDSAIQLWSIGAPASLALETLAEGGDASALVAMFNGKDVAMLGAGAVGPGDTDSLMITAAARHDMRLSLASMLVNSNDAFSGLNALDISKVMVGETLTYPLPAYDAGTEANSEAAGTIPGPADGGEGFSAIRDDVMNKVSRHPGLVTQADDAASVLMPQHRLSNQVGRVVITRID
ncbi:MULTISPECIES: spondin domain-containing protein [unclassified Agarivorans]|uniref:spondin domain-containing protein n=2 Tax=unclassified Agarivorans TaxID=2636026 RepID=UPI003D7EA225